MIRLVRYLGWVSETKERKKDRPLLITTILIPQSNPNIQIHQVQNNIHVSKVHCGSAIEPGASGLPYYCASICVRSCCNWRTSYVDLKPQKRLDWLGFGERYDFSLPVFLYFCTADRFPCTSLSQRWREFFVAGK